MAFDPGLAQRVRELLEELPGYEEKKMFGGICFLIHGNMAGGIIKDELIVRVGPGGPCLRPDAAGNAPLRPHRQGHDGLGDGHRRRLR
jgi:TfoX/Sxy family transcriptional regulator of competence genes